MKILHIISSLKIGGAERALCNLLKELGNKSMQHHVAYFYSGPCLDDIQALGIPTHHIAGLVYRYDFCAYWQLSRLITHIRPDLIHSSLWAANIMARLLGHQHGIPVVSALHGDCRHEGAVRNALDRRTAHLSDATVAVAHSVATSYQQHIIGTIKSPARRDQTQQRLITIPNGIDAAALVASATAHPLTRQEFGISPDAFVVGAVGRLEPIKSYDVLVQAFARLHKHVGTIHCCPGKKSYDTVICHSREGGNPAGAQVAMAGRPGFQTKQNTICPGSPPPRGRHCSNAEATSIKNLPDKQRPVALVIVGDGSQRTALQQQTAALGIAQHVVFTGARADAYRFYPLFDCFALSSQSEGLSIALLESLSFSLPIVTTNATPTHEVLTHDINGFIVPTNDPAALGNALHELYANSSLASAIGTANRVLARQSFSLQSTASKYAKLFTSLIEHTR